jgi:hypothetical protein
VCSNLRKTGCGGGNTVPALTTSASSACRSSRRRRHKRLRGDRHSPHDIRGGRQDTAHAGKIGLQAPRRLLGEVEVGGAEDGDEFASRLVELLALHGLGDPTNAGDRRIDQRLIHRQRHQGRHHAAKVLADHRERALCQIAKIVSEIGIVAVDKFFAAPIAILTETDFPQHVEAHRIDAELLDQRKGIDDIAKRFRHLLAIDGQEAVRKDALLHFDAGAHQEGRPIDRVEADDVLADHVQVGRPVFLELLALSVGITDASDVVGESVNPHIHDVP